MGAFTPNPLDSRDNCGVKVPYADLCDEDGGSNCSMKVTPYTVVLVGVFWRFPAVRKKAEKH
jgi:hypothetical protein